MTLYQPRAAFLPFHLRKERWSCIVAHRRAGKTVACVNELITRALATKKQHARYAYIAPYYSQAKSIAWDYLKQYSNEVRTKVNESELQVEIYTGSKIRLYGADNPDSLRGNYFDGVILDEYADMRPRVWGEIIRPALADRKGWAAFIGTPKGHNAFYEIYKTSREAKEWFSMMLKASRSKLLSLEEIADMMSTMTDDQIAQELECSFSAAIAGAYYGKEMREAEEQKRFKPLEADTFAPVNTAWDLGWSDDTSIWWYQVLGEDIRVLDFFSASGLAMEDYMKVVESKGYKYGKHWLPHDARAKTLASGGKSIEEMMRARFGSGSVRIVPNLTVQDGIQAARAMLPKCTFDSEKCKEGIEALKQYQREWDEDKKVFRQNPRHDWCSHPADAFRMMAVAWRPWAKEPEAPEDKFKPLSEMTYAELKESSRMNRREDRI